MIRVEVFIDSIMIDLETRETNGNKILPVLNPHLNFRNTLFTILKNEPVAKLFWLLPLRFALDFLAGALFLAQGKFSHIRSIVRAHWAFLPKVRHTWRKRRQCQEWIDQCSISDTPNLTAQYPRSIVWQFYLRGIRRFNQL